MKNCATVIKIFFDCHTFDVGPQGTTTFLAGLINSLPGVIESDYPGIAVEIYCAADKKDNIDKYVSVSFSYLRISRSFLMRNLYSIPLAANSVAADFVVSQYVRPIWVPSNSIAIIHDLLFIDFPENFSMSYRYLRTVLFWLSAKFSSHVFTVSDYCKQRISGLYAIPLGDLSVIPNCVGDSGPRFSCNSGLKKNNTRLKIIYVSRFEKRKRQEWCIRALDLLLEAGYDVELTFVGSGNDDYAMGLKNVIKNSTGNRINHFENISTSKLNELYSSSDLLVFPSLGEGFGIPVIEAAAHALPCVVSNGSALTELRPYFSGYSFDPYSFDDFLIGIKKVIDNLDQYKMDATSLVSSVKSKFSWENTARKFISTLLDLRG